MVEGLGVYDGRGAAVIKVLTNITTPASNPIFNIRGEAYNNRAGWFQLQDLTLDGNGFAADWIHFRHASLTRLERVEIRNTVGRDIYGFEWWDSLVHDCTL